MEQENGGKAQVEMLAQFVAVYSLRAHFAILKTKQIKMMLLTKVVPAKPEWYVYLK